MDIGVIGNHDPVKPNGAGRIGIPGGTFFGTVKYMRIKRPGRVQVLITSEPHFIAADLLIRYQLPRSIAPSSKPLSRRDAPRQSWRACELHRHVFVMECPLLLSYHSDHIIAT